MKARVKATGEIINIADYARVTLDKCDSYGSPIELSFDEVEILQERSDNIDWEQRRYEIAKEVLSGILIWIAYSGEDSYCTENCKHAVKYADELVRQLKGK